MRDPNKKYPALVLALLINLLLAGAVHAQFNDLGLGRVEQISLTVSDMARAERFYGEQLGLRKLFAQDNLLVFDLAGQRLLLGPPEPDADIRFPRPAGNAIYLRCADLAVCITTLKQRGVEFFLQPEFVAPLVNFDLWLAFFKDPDGNTFALLSESPRGYNPVTGERRR